MSNLQGINEALELKVAKEFLQLQLAKEKRSMKIRLIVGIVVSVIVFGYMFWLSSMLTRMGTPEYVREAFVTVIHSNAPDLVTMAKRKVLGNRKELVDFLTGEGVEKLVAVLIQEGEKSLKQMIQSIASDTINELNRQFVAVLHKGDSRLRSKLTDLERLHLEEELVAAFDDDLQEAMGQLNFDADFNEPLSVKHRESLAHLNMINDRLRAMAESETLSRKEVLMVRFIKSWSAYVRQAGDEEVDPRHRCNNSSLLAGEPVKPPKCDPGRIPAVRDGRWLCVEPGTCQ